MFTGTQICYNIYASAREYLNNKLIGVVDLT